MLRYILYFIIGGTIVSLVSYIGSIGRGMLAAFISTLPVLTIMTFIFIYLEGGIEATSSYAKGLLIFTPAWLAYIIAVLFAIERFGIWGSLILGFLIFLIIGLAILSISGW